MVASRLMGIDLFSEVEEATGLQIHGHAVLGENKELECFRCELDAAAHACAVRDLEQGGLARRRRPNWQPCTGDDYRAEGDSHIASIQRTVEAGQRSVVRDARDKSEPAAFRQVHPSPAG
ncbi:hypothetical protein BSZ21_01290 [Bradyrhizobium canariense]|nr:hypothetical protein BSZ21_01290 [Bradyrhizobium canariense]